MRFVALHDLRMRDRYGKMFGQLGVDDGKQRLSPVPRRCVQTDTPLRDLPDAGDADSMKGFTAVIDMAVRRMRT